MIAKIMKRRWIMYPVLASLVMGIAIGGMLLWSWWPTSGTLVEQAAQSDISGIKRSLFLRVNINGYSYYGWQRDIKDLTPLASAVRHGSLETVDLLLSEGADPNQRDGVGMPPICWAAIHGRLDVAKELVDSGADVELPNIDYYGNPEKRAVDYALSEGHSELADYLRKKANRLPMAVPIRPPD